MLPRLCFVLWWTGRRCGRDQQRDDVADQMTDYFHAHNDDAAILGREALEPNASLHVRACEKTVLFMMLALRVCILCTLLAHQTERNNCATSKYAQNSPRC